MQSVESRDLSVNPFNLSSQATAMAGTINRPAVDLISGLGVNSDNFKKNMASILSEYDQDILEHLSQRMSITLGTKEETIQSLSDEFLNDALADICTTGYVNTGKFDLKFIEELLPSPKQRNQLPQYIKRKLKQLGRPEDAKAVENLLFVEPEKESTSKQKPENKRKVKDELARLLSKGKKEEAREIIDDLSNRFEDTSWKIRKKVAESFGDIISVLDEFDELKENFQEISNTLIKSMKKEVHLDTYLAEAENFRNICTSRNNINKFYTNETIGSRLFESQKISKAQLQKVLLARKENGKSLPYNLGALNFVEEPALVYFLSQQYKGCKTVVLSNMYTIPDNALNAIPLKFIKRFLVLPFNLNNGHLHTAAMDPNNFYAFDDIRFITGYSVAPHLASEFHLLDAVKKFYAIEIDTPEIQSFMENIQEQEKELEFEQETEEQVITTEKLNESDAPVVRLVNLILKEAISQKASDIHIEPYENQLRVRFRIDGTLTTWLTPPVRYSSVLASRIKVISKLDISEKRLPQDGRFKLRNNGSQVDFRVSTFPGMFGEKVVLRLLDQSSLIMRVNKLGLKGDDLKHVLTAMYKTKGMILVTGPTGSGKTTTLYSMLNDLNDGSRNISTAEDPVEYNLSGVNQFQMNPRIGMDFARALRTFLRQDPDIIMVGEIRDYETAEIAVKAALTGHLVLSTLHTNSAVETITRLLDIGIQPYLVNSSINIIVAQRLMRKVCERCKAETSPNELQSRLLNDHGLDISRHKVYKGEGCPECNNTGYKGRVAVHEVMPLWEGIKEAILRGKSSSGLEAKAVSQGFSTLPECGFQKVIQGVTDLDEWMRVVA